MQLPVKKAMRSAFSADGARVLVCSLLSPDVWLMDVRSGDRLETFKGHPKRGVFDVTWSHDERRALVGGSDGTVRVWDIASAQCTATLETGGKVFSVAWWTDDRFVVAGLVTGALQVWDVERRELVRNLTGHTSVVNTLEVRADQNLLLSASADRTASLWNLDSGECLQVLQGHAGNVWSAVFSRSGCALSASEDRTLRLWDLATGHCMRVLEGHTDRVVTVVRHPSDTSLAASASTDQTIRVWNVDTGACLCVHGPAKPLFEYFHWSGNGNILWWCDAFGTVVSWDLTAVLAAAGQHTNG